MKKNKLLSLAFLRNNLPQLLRHEGFRASPARIILRGGLWALHGLFSKEVIFRYDGYGNRLRVVPNERRVGASSAYIFRDTAEPELRGLDLLLRPGDTFIDCGANIGVFSLKAAAIVGSDGRVIAIEPGLESVTRLRNNIDLNRHGNVVVVNKAASDKGGTARLYHSGEGPVAYSLVAQPGAEYEEVEISTLDEIAASEDVAGVDCIKIDVEGAEASVLSGAQGLLARWRPTVIFEINSAGTMRSGTDPRMAWDILSGLGYRFFLMRDRKLIRQDEFPHINGNLVAIGREDRVATVTG